MATVKTVLVKGRSTRNGRFPLSYRCFTKRKKKVVYTGLQRCGKPVDRPSGCIINEGKATRNSSEEFNSKCEGISRTLLKSVSMTEKKLCVYEIEDVFKTYDLLTHGTGFYSYISDKIRELRQSGHEGTARSIQFQPKFSEKIFRQQGFSIQQTPHPR